LILPNGGTERGRQLSGKGIQGVELQSARKRAKEKRGMCQLLTLQTHMAKEGETVGGKATGCAQRKVLEIIEKMDKNRMRRT